MKIGVGQSVRHLRKQHGMLRGLVLSRSYAPERLLTGLGKHSGSGSSRCPTPRSWSGARSCTTPATREPRRDGRVQVRRPPYRILFGRGLLEEVGAEVARLRRSRVLLLSADGKKTTRSSPSILPETVIYDVDLSIGLPVPIAVTSAVNALAHAVEALYSAQANPIVDGWAVDAISGIGNGLRRLADEPTDLEVRSDLLRGAWLAGMCLASVGMGLHHKLCHVLGGSFGLPHASTHTVVLPHVMSYNAPAVPEVMERIGRALDAPDAPSGVFDLIERVDGPTSLRALGLGLGDLGEVADQVTASPYPNPQPPAREGILELLTGAWHGVRP